LYYKEVFLISYQKKSRKWGKVVDCGLKSL